MAGEDVGPDSIWNSIDLLKIERIGHGISAIQDEKLMKRLKKDQTPIELCPTSNLFTRKYVSEISEHPIRAFYDKGLYVTLNSDGSYPFRIRACRRVYYAEGFRNLYRRRTL